MKAILSLLLLITVSIQSLHAQTIQTLAFANTGTGPTRQQDISVPTGQVFELLTWSTSYNGPTAIKVDGIDVLITRPRKFYSVK